MKGKHMILPAPTFPAVLGESAGARIVRIVRAYVGCSLHVRRQDLAALVGRGVDDEAIVGWETNCCTFALGVLAAAGVDFPSLRIPLRNGFEFGVLVQLGNRFDAWRKPAPGDPPPPAGALLWYEIDGTNDDHVEIMLAPPDEHGGGGRPDNAITSGRGDVHASWSRPLHRWLDPEALCLPDPHVDPDQTLQPA
jgi:hypothetical protein